MYLNNLSLIRGLLRHNHLFYKKGDLSTSTSPSLSNLNSGGVGDFINKQQQQQQKPIFLSSSSSNITTTTIPKLNSFSSTTSSLLSKTESFDQKISRYYNTTSNSSEPKPPLGENNNNNNNINNSQQQQQHRIQNIKRKFREKGIFLILSNASNRIKFILTRHKPLTSDQIFAIFSWLLFGTGSLVIVGTTMVVSLILWIVNTFEFSEWAANKIGKYLTNNTGITITFDSARGEWKTGHIRIENVNVSRRPRGDEHLSTIQLSIKQIDIKLSLLWMLEGRGLIQECLVSGVRGTIDRRTEGFYVNNNMIYPRKKKAPGDFVFEKLEVKDLLITFYLPDRSHRPLSISIYNLESDRFRKQWLLIDLLSSKNISGKFDNSLFQFTTPQNHTVDNNKASNYQVRELKIDGVNIDILSRNATGPLGWIKEGTIDINLNLHIPNIPDHEILESEQDTIEYGIIPIDEVAPLYTPELSYLSNALAHPIVAYINSHSKHIPLNFNFAMNIRQFNGSWTPSQASFWDMLSASVAQELSMKVQETKNVTTLKKVASELITEFVQWLIPILQSDRRYLFEEEIMGGGTDELISGSNSSSGGSEDESNDSEITTIPLQNQQFYYYQKYLEEQMEQRKYLQKKSQIYNGSNGSGDQKNQNNNNNNDNNNGGDNLMDNNSSNSLDDNKIVQDNHITSGNANNFEPIVNEPTTLDQNHILNRVVSNQYNLKSI
eukprot:gene830-1037_t